MKPRHFIQSPLSTTASETQHALDPVDAESLGQTVFVKADIDRDDAPFTFLDGIFNVKVSGKDKQGRCVIFDTLRPNKVGPALHLHTDCDEWFFVREGEFKFQVGEDTLRLKPGDSLLQLATREKPVAPSSLVVYALPCMAAAATIRQRNTTGKKTNADGLSTTSFDAAAPRFTTSIIPPARSSAKLIVASNTNALTNVVGKVRPL